MQSRAHRCSLTGQPTPHLVEIQRLLGIPRLDEQFVGQGAILRAVAVRVAGNASRSPVLVKCSLDTCSTQDGPVWAETARLNFPTAQTQIIKQKY